MLSLVIAAALAHPQGFHERIALSVSRNAVDALLVLDVDSGERAKLMRAGADLNRDGVISTDERAALQKKLVQLATQGLKLSLSGFPLTVKITDIKLSTRDDKEVSETGLSLALMLEATVKAPINEGIKLEVQAVSPDQSHVLVEVSALSSRDGGAVALEKRELSPDEKWSVRLGVTGPALSTER